MIKISFFVEGQTERIFLEKFLNEYLTTAKIIIESHKFIGDRILTIRARKPNSNTQVYILIYEVACGDRVVDALLEKAENMISNQGYNQLLALKDLYPIPFNKKSLTINAILKEFNKSHFADKLKLILAIMEIEAWFLTDYNLFKKISPSLTPEFIKEKTGLDLINDDPEITYHHPSETVSTILSLNKRKYKKKEKQIYNMVHNINYEFLCCGGVSNKIKSFFYFLKCVDEGISNN